MNSKLKPGMRKIWTAALPVLLLAAAVVLGGCTPGDLSTPSGPSQTLPAILPTAGKPPAPLVTVIRPDTTPGAETAPTQAVIPAGGPKTAVIAFVQDFDNLNPMYAQALSSIYSQPIYSCRAWDLDDGNNPVPTVVAEMPTLQNGGISEDGRVITLKLREDARWSDGQPLTAEDFVFTYQMILDPNNAAIDKTPYDLVESVTAPDAQTVVTTFRQPYAAWMTSLWRLLLPKHVLEPVYTAQGNLVNAEWNQAPTVGCGPFVFAGREAGSQARFIANEQYWLGRPKLDEIQVRFLADDSAKVEALKSGQADLTVFLIDSSQFLSDLSAANLQVLPVNAGYNEGWFFFLDPAEGHPALQDGRVRQALALGLNRDQMVRDLLGSGRELVASYWDGTPYLEPSIQPWPYDPDRARALLDEAGWVDTNGNGTRDKDGVELVLTHGTTTNTLRQAVQNAARTQLAEIGVTLDLFNYDSDVFFSGYNEGGPAATGQLDIFQYAARTKNYPDPGTNDFLCAQIPSNDELGENWSWLCDQPLDQLLQTQAAQIDFEQRQSTFNKISKMIYDNVYFLGFWTDPDIWAAAQRLKNVRLSGVMPLYNVAEWDLGQ